MRRWWTLVSAVATQHDLTAELLRHQGVAGKEIGDYERSHTPAAIEADRLAASEKLDALPAFDQPDAKIAEAIKREAVRDAQRDVAQCQADLAGDGRGAELSWVQMVSPAARPSSTWSSMTRPSRTPQRRPHGKLCAPSSSLRPACRPTSVTGQRHRSASARYEQANKVLTVLAAPAIEQVVEATAERPGDGKELSPADKAAWAEKRQLERQRAILAARTKGIITIEEALDLAQDHPQMMMVM